MRWTITSTSSGDGIDLAVRAGPGATWRQAWPAVREAVGLAAGSVPTVAGKVLDDDLLVGRGPLVDGADLVAGPAGWTPAAHGPAGAAELLVVTGTDAGRSHPLRPGGTMVGRGGDCDIRLSDPDLSRCHALVTLRPDGVGVADLGSRNGTVLVLPREPAGPPPPPVFAPRSPVSTPAPVGSTLVLGSTVLEVRTIVPVPPDPGGPAGQPAREHAGQGEDGTTVHSCIPRARPRPAERTYRLPAEPTRPVARRIPWVSAAVPVLVAVPLALWWGSPIFLALGLLGPVMVLGSVIGDRTDGRRRHAAAGRAHVADTAATRLAAEVACADAADLARHEHPDLGWVAAAAAGRDARLWERDASQDDTFVVRVATSDLPGPVVVQDADGGVIDRPVMSRVPVTVDAGDGLAIVGPGDWGRAVARAVVGRAVVALAPTELAVDVRSCEAAAAAWRWTRWLPHTGSPAARRLVVLDGAGLVPPESDEDRADGDLVIAIATDPAGVPPGLGTWIRPDGETGSGVRISSRSGDATGVAELASPGWAERLGRSLAPLRAPDRGGALPARVDHHMLAPGAAGDLTDPGHLAKGWDGDDGLLRVPIGVGPAGPVEVDLVTDGPHALVAGTTGSGKSELLRTLVLGLAARYPPQSVAFVLADFKGGSTFAQAAALPHTIATVTDLDIVAAMRILAGLRAELRRREAALARAGARDLAELRLKPGAGDADPLPRLIVVVDEFRVLAEEAPAVLEGLVRVATVGRSLGVHLVLATQRPAGVVSADIRANTSLRIALRVEDDADSREVVGVPDAAAIPRSFPGRAVVTRGGATSTVQTARVHRGDDEAPGVVVQRLDVAWPGTGVAQEPVAGAPTADPAAQALVDTITAAVALAGRRRALAPWPPPLPAQLDAPGPGAPDALPPDDRAGTPGPALVVGVCDLAEHLARSTLSWRPQEDGALIAVGGPSSGRTSLLRLLAHGARAAGLPVVLLTLDPLGHGGRTSAGADGGRGGGGGAAAWPGTEIVDATQTDHLADVLAALASRTSGDDWLVLLVDDADSLVDRAAARPELYDALTSTLRDAPACRIAVALTGGRALATSRTGASGRVTLLLRPTDPVDAALLGIAAAALPGAAPPGRFLATGTGLAAQAVEGQVLWVDPGARHDDDDGHPTLPARRGIVPAALPRRAGLPPSPGWPRLALGVGYAGAVDVDVLRHAGLVVAGPAGSGRTTALRALAASAAGCGVPAVRVVRVVPDSRLRTDRGGAGEAGEAGEAVLAAVLERIRAGTAGGLLVLIDDVDRAGADLDTALPELLAAADRGVALVMAGSAGWLGASFGGVAAVARRRGSGLLLRPGRTDGRDLLGTAVAAQDARIPGRGVLVLGGSVSRVQIGVTPGGSSSAARDGPT